MSLEVCTKTRRYYPEKKKQKEEECMTDIEKQLS
jgi:hypothetical protein